MEIVESSLHATRQRVYFHVSRVSRFSSCTVAFCFEEAECIDSRATASMESACKGWRWVDKKYDFFYYLCSARVSCIVSAS